MAITWTIIVLGALLHGTHSDLSKPLDSSTQPMQPTPANVSHQYNPTTTPLQSVSTETPLQTSHASSIQTTVQQPSVTTQTGSKIADLTSQTADSSTSQAQPNPTGVPSTNAALTVSTHNPENSITNSVSPTSLTQETSSSGRSSATTHSQDGAPIPPSDQVTTLKDPSTATVPTTTENSISHNKPLPSESSTQTATSKYTTGSPNGETLYPRAPDSTSAISQRHQTLKIPTTAYQITSTPIPGSRRHDDDTTTSISTPKIEDRTPGIFLSHKFDLSNATEGNILSEACKALGPKMKGHCSVTMKIDGKQLTATFTIDAHRLIPQELYNPPVQEKNINEESRSKESMPDTLIAILASCGALVLILCCFAAYCNYHRRSYRKNQQHLTEEMQTVENGYHDNPTLEVMEVQPEMQEKKRALNGELNDSWIVPIDNLLKEDIPDEEDTHL
ncbi:podocalyxin-like [Myxocyprinus asiaticus]|uniref:podocalyxin-like n=1 Tax=Myxocyprinus asiaticus TaxID=70543 RepID=UPI002221E929|nr:podocalyxin-like [Myxocyprinus asiaticus]